MALRIGILQTDSVRPQFQDEHGDYPAMFRRLLLDAATEPLEFSVHDVRASVPAEVACDAYVITGSKHSVYEDLPWISALADFVREALAADANVIGICFGHQLIAHFFGGEVRKADVGWGVGVHEAEVVRQAPWMGAAPAQRLRLLCSHQDQVMRAPREAALYAKSAFCPISGFTMPGVMTIQGHPEFTRSYSRDLMNFRAPMLGSDTHAAGLASLAQETDEREFARWMLAFAEEARRRRLEAS